MFVLLSYFIEGLIAFIDFSCDMFDSSVLEPFTKTRVNVAILYIEIISRNLINFVD